MDQFKYSMASILYSLLVCSKRYFPQPAKNGELAQYFLLRTKIKISVKIPEYSGTLHFLQVCHELMF